MDIHNHFSNIFCYGFMGKNYTRDHRMRSYNSSCKNEDIRKKMPKKITEEGLCNPSSVIFILTLYYPSMALRSSSGVEIGFMLNFSTSTFSTFGDTNAGSDGPSLISFIPR